MNKFKIISLIWGIILVGLLVILTLFGKVYLRKIEPYERLEINLVNAANNYVDSKLDLQKGTTIIKYSELKDANFIDKLEVKNDKCDGYVKVIKKKNVKYQAYIKCNKYQTKGYEK